MLEDKRGKENVRGLPVEKIVEFMEALNGVVGYDQEFKFIKLMFEQKSFYINGTLNPWLTKVGLRNPQLDAAAIEHLDMAQCIEGISVFRSRRSPEYQDNIPLLQARLDALVAEHPGEYIKASFEAFGLPYPIYNDDVVVSCTTTKEGATHIANQLSHVLFSLKKIEGFTFPPTTYLDRSADSRRDNQWSFFVLKVIDECFQDPSNQSCLATYGAEIKEVVDILRSNLNAVQNK